MPAVLHAGAMGISFLCQCFFFLTKLQHLNLSYNLIGPDGAGFLSLSLPLLEHLTTLRLQGNMLCKEGITALAPALNSLKAGENRILDLSNNHLTSVEAREMRELIGSQGMTNLSQKLGSVKFQA